MAAGHGRVAVPVAQQRTYNTPLGNASYIRVKRVVDKAEQPKSERPCVSALSCTYAEYGYYVDRLGAVAFAVGGTAS